MRAIMVCVGDLFGRLTVIKVERYRKNSISTTVRCVCGEVFKIGASYLGSVKSCGCLRADREVVNKSISSARRRGSSVNGASVDHPTEWLAWSNMINRCYDKGNPQFDDYGGRGIKVCPRWRSFWNFLADMGKKPSPELTLERVNNNEGYSPDNCKWATRHEQTRNERRNVNITFRGVTKCLTGWASEIGISTFSLKRRLERWDLEAALTTPRLSCGR